MIIYLNQSGRFGHQLNMFVLLYIYAAKYKRPFYYPLFVKKYLLFIESNKLNNTLILRKLNFAHNIYLNSILCYLKFIARNKQSDTWKNRFPFLDTSYSDILVGENRISAMYQFEKEVVTNYLITDIKAFLEYRTMVKNQILFNAVIENKIHQQFNSLRNNGYVIIGLHIRQSDFKRFLNGKFYYETNVYFKKLEKCIQLINAKCIVFICSDDKLNIDAYSDKFTNLQYEQRHFMEDFLMLKNADYLIATRSAFSMMASYFGENKIYQIMNDDPDEVIEFLDYEMLLKRHYDFDNLDNRMKD